jgi:hypothetical protein
VAEPRELELRDARRDGPARFLRELRELRNHAGLGYAELAARAHYPCDAIKAAEAGPSLPDLPVLSAYVRGCGGTTAEWEERWRAVTGCPASPVLMARAAGCSAAADAGARVGAASAAADGHDPDRVMAALNRVADGMAAAASSSGTTGSGPAGPAASGTALAHAALPDATVPQARPSEAGVFDPAVPQATPPDAGTFDAAAFEALAATPAAPAPRAGAWDSVPPAPMADALTPTSAATEAPAAVTRDAAAVTPPAADMTHPAAPPGASPAQTRRAGNSRHPRLSRIALAALIVVALLLVATLLAIIA